MTVLKAYDSGAEEWQTIVVGKQGPQGIVGPAGVIASDTAPEDTDVVWVDTSESGAGLSPADIGAVAVADGVVVFEHGSDDTEPRPAYAGLVYWKGDVAPQNGVNGDLWYDTTGDS